MKKYNYSDSVQSSADTVNDTCWMAEQTISVNGNDNNQEYWMN